MRKSWIMSNNTPFVFGTLFIDSFISDKIVSTMKKNKIIKNGMNEDSRLLKQNEVKEIILGNV